MPRAKEHGRAYRTVDVHRPWAWCWWPPGDLIGQHPDDTDRRDARTISTAPIDWSAILQAVRYAIARCPAGPEALQLESVCVALPMPLSTLEYTIVASWVGAATPVVYRYEDDTIEDGRHRLWLTKPYVGDEPVPVVAANLYYLDDALKGGPTASIFPETLDDARLWWQMAAPSDLRYANRAHRRMLAHAYLELTAPEPVPPRWFDQLHDWDNALPTLAQLHADNRTDRDLLRHALPHAWRFRQDQHGVTPDLALGMFRTMAGVDGFTMWGNPAPRPHGRLTLYRGATPSNRAGLSWTIEPQIAHHFATTRQAPGTRSAVWIARVPATRLLAYFPDENEFVADLTGVEHLVTAAPPDARTHLPTKWQAARLRRLDDRRTWA